MDQNTEISFVRKKSSKKISKLQKIRKLLLPKSNLGSSGRKFDPETWSLRPPRAGINLIHHLNRINEIIPSRIFCRSRSWSFDFSIVLEFDIIVQTFASCCSDSFQVSDF